MSTLEYKCDLLNTKMSTVEQKYGLLNIHVNLE